MNASVGSRIPCALKTAVLSICVVIIAAVQTRAQTPQWIWDAATNSQTIYLRKSFRTPPLTWNARLTVSADDRAEVFLNGVSVGKCSDWHRPMRSEVSVRLNQGENVIAVKAENASGPAGVLVQLNANGQTNIVSDSSWLVATNEEANWSALTFNASHWRRAVAWANHGEPPWGDVLFHASATPAESLKLLDGFHAELLRSAEPDEGSWICMAFDNRGRLLISPQGDERPLLRLSFEQRKITSVEKLKAPIHYAMGLLWAFDSLYANAHGPNGTGLYRLKDENNNGDFETNEIRLLQKFRGESEHGYHALALGPDEKIYVLNGNGTRLPDGVSDASPYRNYAEDALAGGHGAEGDQDGTRAPVCHVLQTDAAGHAWKLWAGGMRNAYDMDFNEQGELFTFDSDMEWDWGTAWYRPTRILHLVPGGEYGWRDGTRMWSDHYPDALPPVTSIGIGSPTGVKFGTKSKFPGKYQHALYVQDWSYGRILAVHLSPAGSSYQAQWETFVQGTPLNLTALAFGPDGAMYFITGGRGTQSGLYRVTAEVRPEGRHELVQDLAAESARRVRHTMEELQGRKEPAALESIISQLSTNKDRFVLHAARVALESQPLELWESKALTKGGGDGPAMMLLALVRSGGPEQAWRGVQRAIELYGPDSRALRLAEIALARHGPPPQATADLLAGLNAIFPSSDPVQNHEVCRILLRLGSPQAVAATMRLLGKAATQEEQTFYVEQLRNVRKGWSLEDRRAFLSWFVKPRDPKAHPSEIIGYFKDVGRGYVDGAWFDKYLRDFRRQAANTLTAEERAQLEPLLLRPVTQAQSVPAQQREFIREWKMEDLLAELDREHGINLKKGRQALADAQCLNCHRFGNDGGVVGPELTGIGSKYSARDILESIIEPSKVLSDQYQDYTAFLKDGDSVTGRLVSDSDKEVVLETDRLSGATEKIRREQLAKLAPSPMSPMPAGLVNVLSKEEVLDLVAYLRKGLAVP